MKPERQKALEEAISLTTGDRNKQYGDPYENLTKAAEMQTAFFGYKVTAADVAWQMHFVKLSRIAHDPLHWDSYVDGMAYQAIALECAVHEPNEDRWWAVKDELFRQLDEIRPPWYKIGGHIKQHPLPGSVMAFFERNPSLSMPEITFFQKNVVPEFGIILSWGSSPDPLEAIRICFAENGEYSLDGFGTEGDLVKSIMKTKRRQNE